MRSRSPPTAKLFLALGGINAALVVALGAFGLPLGLRVELTPLFHLCGNLIANLNEGSRFLQLRGVYDWREDVQWMAGLNPPSGSRGTE
jgi:hypothetical protein